MNPVKESPRPKRIRRGAEELQAIVQQYASSGMSRSAFCRKHGLAPGTFDRWHRSLDRSTREAPEALFVELPVTNDAPPGALQEEQIPIPPPIWDIELQLGGDMVLRLRRPC